MVTLSSASSQITRISILIFLFFSMGNGQESHPPVKKELGPLQHYLGTWESEFTISNGQSAKNREVFQGTVTGKWIVGGAFLEQSGINTLNPSSKPFEFRTLMAYNKSSDSFDFYYFYPSGDVFKSRADWNEKHKIMTSIRKEPSGQSVKITADFSTPDHERWTIVIKDSNDQIKMRIEGHNRKRKND